MFCLFISAAFGQDEGYLEFSGRAIKSDKPLEGAKVVVWAGSTKISELTTPKNGKFSFDLDLGLDYKVTFAYPGCVDMNLVIIGSKCPSNKVIFPIYDVAVRFFEYGKTNVNYQHFKEPFTKIIFDGNKTFKDDDAYLQKFLSTIYVNDEERIKKEEEDAARKKAEEEMAEKKRWEELEKERLEAERKRKEEEHIRLEQIAALERKAKEEADALAKSMEVKKKEEKKIEERKTPAPEPTTETQSLVKEELKLTLDKEQKKVKEKQNKAIKSNYESDLLKQMAENERLVKEQDYKKQKAKVTSNEIVEILHTEAVTKAQSEEVRFQMKVKNKQAVLNSRISNQEMTNLIKVVAYNDYHYKAAHLIKQPNTKNYKAKSMVGITTDFQTTSFKSVYTIQLFEGDKKTQYRKEKYTWGVVYYYKNNKEIDEATYIKELSQYNVAL